MWLRLGRNVAISDLLSGRPSGGIGIIYSEQHSGLIWMREVCRQREGLYWGGMGNLKNL